MTRLVLIRHGEAQCHIDGIVGGERSCTGLSLLGWRQVDALRARLARTGELGDTAALYASTLPRAVETAERIAPAIGGLTVRPERELREWDPGEADGLTYEDFETRYVRPSRPPGAESWGAFRERVIQALERLVKQHPDETVVVVCHGGVIENAFHLWGVDRSDGIPLEITNTGITELRWTEPWPWHPRQAPGWRLVRHNDAAHLAGLA